MAKQRLDQKLVQLGLVASRSQAESYIKLGEVKVEGKVITKPGFLASDDTRIQLTAKEQYVSRAGLKLASVADVFRLDFRDKVVLDVGSSTGGFTDYALQHGAKKVIAVEVGTNQLHPNLQGDARIDLYEKTDIRQVWLRQTEPRAETAVFIDTAPDIVLADVSFISLRELLPHISRLLAPSSQLVVMVKPQFEAGESVKHKGVIKNDRVRREILKDFEAWAQTKFVVMDKADSEVAGAKGNKERFYLLRLMREPTVPASRLAE